MSSLEKKSNLAFALPAVFGAAVVLIMALLLGRSLTPGGPLQALIGFAQNCVNRVTAALGGLRPVAYQSLLPLLPAVLVVGLFILSLLRQALATKRFMRSLRFIARSDRTRAANSSLVARCGLKSEDVVIIESDQPVCFCAGLLRPRLFISEAALRELTADELLAVVAHEKRHLLGLDPLRSAILRALGQALFFIPLMRSFEDRFKLAKELAADAEALRLPNGRLNLARALYKISALTGDARHASLAFFAEHCSLDIRLSFIAGRGRLPKPFKAGAVITSLAAVAGLLAVTTPVLAKTPSSSCPRAATSTQTAHVTHELLPVWRLIPESSNQLMTSYAP